MSRNRGGHSAFRIVVLVVYCCALALDRSGLEATQSDAPRGATAEQLFKQYSSGAFDAVKAQFASVDNWDLVVRDAERLSVADKEGGAGISRSETRELDEAPRRIETEDALRIVGHQDGVT